MENKDKNKNESDPEIYKIYNIKPEKQYKKEFYFYKIKDMFLCENCKNNKNIIEHDDIFKVIKLEKINNDYNKESDKNKICYSIIKNKLFCERDEYKKEDENIIIINEMKKNLNIEKIKNYINECSNGDYFKKIKEAAVNQIEKLKEIS